MVLGRRSWFRRGVHSWGSCRQIGFSSHLTNRLANRELFPYPFPFAPSLRPENIIAIHHAYLRNQQPRKSLQHPRGYQLQRREQLPLLEQQWLVLLLQRQREQVL
jgi:hypothetical protein